jgi:hypothetical protein
MSRHSRDAFPDNGFLRGADNQFVGRIERRSDGSEWIVDLPDNQYVGRYDPHTNQTWDISGNLVGFGNLLTSLLGRK